MSQGRLLLAAPRSEEEEIEQLARALAASLAVSAPTEGAPPSRAAARGRAAVASAGSRVPAPLAVAQPAAGSGVGGPQLRRATLAAARNLLAGPAETRLYAVWAIPGRQWLHGVVLAHGLDPWAVFRTLLPEARYCASDGTRIRRSPGSLDEAIQLYASEAHVHAVPQSPAFWIIR